MYSVEHKVIKTFSAFQLLAYFEQLKNTQEGLQLSSDLLARDVYRLVFS